MGSFIVIIKILSPSQSSRGSSERTRLELVCVVYVHFERRGRRPRMSTTHQGDFRQQRQQLGTSSPISPFHEKAATSKGDPGNPGNPGPALYHLRTIHGGLALLVGVGGSLLSIGDRGCLVVVDSTLTDSLTRIPFPNSCIGMLTRCATIAILSDSLDPSSTKTEVSLLVELCSRILGASSSNTLPCASNLGLTQTLVVTPPLWPLI